MVQSVFSLVLKMSNKRQVLQSSRYWGAGKMLH
jgi:hypothetical protein